MRAAAAIAAGAALLAGCALPGARAPLVEGPVAEAAQRDGQLDAAVRGRQLYVSRCTECHSAMRPSDLTTQDWDKVLPRMARLAALSPAEVEDVRAYVTAALRAAPQPVAR